MRVCLIACGGLHNAAVTEEVYIHIIIIRFNFHTFKL